MKTAHFDFCVSLLLFFILLPLPMGLGRTEINALLSIIAVIGAITFNVVVTRQLLVIIALFVAFVSLSTFLDVVRNPQFGFDGGQAFRELYFLAVGALIVTWGGDKSDLFRSIDRNLRLCLFALVLQIPLAKFAPSLANISLGGVEEGGISSETAARLYIYPHAFLYAILPALVIRNRYIEASLCSIILVGTGSKQVLIFIILAWIIAGFDYSRIKKSLLVVLILFTLLSGSFAFGVIDRFVSIYIDGGDHVRAEEISAALERWRQDVVSTMFGIGVGTRYWEGWDQVLRNFDNDPSLINSGYDVHNGFAGLLLRLGAVGSASILVILLWLHLKLPAKVSFLMVSGIGLSLASSSAFYTNDFPHYVISFGYVVWCFRAGVSPSSLPLHRVKI